MREREAEVLDRARVSLLPPPLLWRRRHRRRGRPCTQRDTIQYIQYNTTQCTLKSGSS